jgi:hypothetical protein
MADVAVKQLNEGATPLSSHNDRARAETWTRLCSETFLRVEHFRCGSVTGIPAPSEKSEWKPDKGWMPKEE